MRVRKTATYPQKYSPVKKRIFEAIHLKISCFSTALNNEISIQIL